MKIKLDDMIIAFLCNYYIVSNLFLQVRLNVIIGYGLHKKRKVKSVSKF